MTSILMNQSPEDQFLHWRQDMERKQEEQAREMRELQDQAERLRRENDRHDLGKDVIDSGCDGQLVTP